MNFSRYLMDDFQRDVNKTMAQVCRFGGLLMIIVIILNATGVEVDDLPMNPKVLFRRFSEEGLIHDPWNHDSLREEK